jgi:hypothetical protein
MGGANQLEAVMARLQNRDPRFSDPESEDPGSEDPENERPES